jgi:CBS domain-containing membrane protein
MAVLEPTRPRRMTATVTRSPGKFTAWLQALRPVRMQVDALERLRIVLGAGIGIAFAAWLSHLAAPDASVWLVGPLGASAVLVFGVPASPLAQPWAVVAGNAASALVGILCVRWLDAALLPTASLAVALAIAAMFALRCLHPPGGAMALTMALGQIADPAFAAVPVLLNSVLLVVAGIAWNNATRRRYPHAQTVAAAAAPGPVHEVVTGADVDAALRRYNQILDVPRDDLQALLQDAEANAYRRRLGELRCADVMSRDLATVQFGTPLEEAWALLRRRRIKSLPVLDRAQRVVGIVTLADFMRAAELDLHAGFDAKLRALIRRSGLSHGDKPEVVGQIMTRQVRVASLDRPVAELVPLFASTGHHHIPVIDAAGRIAGMLTQSDVVAALCAPPGAAQKP